MKTQYTSYDESEILSLFGEAAPVAPPAPDAGAAPQPMDAPAPDQSQQDQGQDAGGEKPPAQDDHLLDQSDDVKEQFKNIDNVNELIEFIFSNKTLAKKVIKWWNKRKDSDESKDGSSAPMDQGQDQGQDQSAAPAPAQGM